MTDLQKEKIRTMRMQGMSYVKIGEILGIPDNTVRSFCRRCGLGEEAKNTCCCKQCGKLIKIIPKRMRQAVHGLREQGEKVLLPPMLYRRPLRR